MIAPEQENQQWKKSYRADEQVPDYESDAFYRREPRYGQLRNAWEYFKAPRYQRELMMQDAVNSDILKAPRYQRKLMMQDSVKSDILKASRYQRELMMQDSVNSDILKASRYQ